MTRGPFLVPAAAGVALLAALVLDLHNTAADRVQAGTAWGSVSALPGLILAVGAAVVLRVDRRHGAGWTMAVGGVFWAVDGVAESWLTTAVAAVPTLPLAALAYWVYARLGAVLLLVVPVVITLYPQGRLPHGRWRPALLAGLGLAAVLPMVLLVAPSAVAADRSGGPLPPGLTGIDLDLTTLPLPAGLAEALLRLSFPAALLGSLVPVLWTVHRYRVGDADNRRRLRWLVWAGSVVLLVGIGGLLLPSAVGGVLMLIAVTTTTVAVTVGIVRPDLVDVDRLLGGTALYAVLAAVVVAVDLAVLAATGLLLDGVLSERASLILALLVTTAIYLPLRAQLWRLGRRLFFGNRGDRYGVLSALSARLEETDDEPGHQLTAVAALLADTFRVASVGIEVRQLDGTTATATSGPVPAEVQELPITYRGEDVGLLRLPAGGARARLTTRDQELLADVVRQTVLAARNAELARDLQRSREQLVLTREEERRRIRRDLHDGLGPALGAVGLRLDTARNWLRRDPDRAEELLVTGRNEIAATLADVRRLVHELRPPALDDVGLIGALRQLVEGLSTEGGPQLRIESSDLGALPAATEVAIYRIVAEGLTNVVRHAQATGAVAAVSRSEGGVLIEIIDDGVGIAAETVAGVGLVSMRERAAELGGRLEISCPDGGGSAVLARLPVAGGAR